MDSRAFLEWALPRLGLRTAGFVRVRGQVQKRVARRIAELRLSGFEAYRAYLEQHAEEWAALDEFSHITISRFFRDGHVYAALQHCVLPRLIELARARGEQRVRIWSAGAGAGEEPYSISLLWRYALRERFADIALELVATDADPNQLARARQGRYRASSLREVPHEFRARAFAQVGADEFAISSELRDPVQFLQQDLRREMPPGPFALILCRNLAFSYFSESEQLRAAQAIRCRLQPGSVLALGLREKPPVGAGFEAIADCLFVRQDDESAINFKNEMARFCFALVSS